MRRLVSDLNRVYSDERALWDIDFEPAGFAWLEPNDAENNVVSFLRRAENDEQVLVAACNFSPVPRYDYRMGLPRGGRWREAINTDAERLRRLERRQLRRRGGGGHAVARPAVLGRAQLPPLGRGLARARVGRRRRQSCVRRSTGRL